MLSGRLHARAPSVSGHLCVVTTRIKGEPKLYSRHPMWGTEATLPPPPPCAGTPELLVMATVALSCPPQALPLTNSLFPFSWLFCGS